MTREETITHLKRIAQRRRTFHIGGQVREAAPDDTDRALALAIKALERDRWIPREESYPDCDPHERVLVYTDED